MESVPKVAREAAEVVAEDDDSDPDTDINDTGEYLGFAGADAVGKANKAAAKTVERLGAQDSIPWRDEL